MNGESGFINFGFLGPILALMRKFVIRHVCRSVSLPCIVGFASFQNSKWHASRKLRNCRFIMNDDDDDDEELLVLFP